MNCEMWSMICELDVAKCSNNQELFAKSANRSKKL